MAREANIVTSLRINKGNIRYQNQPTNFVADVSGSKGPTPGAITATTAGTDVDLSELTTPGLCRIQNTDDANYVQVGVWNPDQNEFYPVMRLLPGESFVIRLDPHVNQEYEQTGTGTTGQLNTLRILAANASCVVVVEAFEA